MRQPCTKGKRHRLPGPVVVDWEALWRSCHRNATIKPNPSPTSPPFGDARASFMKTLTKILDDRMLVARLIEGDTEAWRHVTEQIALPLVRADVRGIATRCARCGVSPEAVISRLYVNLSKNEHASLRAFRFECAFSSWLCWQLWDASQGAIREAMGKINLTLSDPVDLDALTEQKASPAPMENKEEIAFANRLLAKLWERKPSQALVLLLRNDLELSSKAVGAFLGKSPANVDQINHRAQTSMRALRDAEQLSVR